MKITLHLTTQGNGRSKEYWQRQCNFYVEEELKEDIKLDSKLLKEWATNKIYNNFRLELEDEWRDRYTSISIDVDIRKIKKEILYEDWLLYKDDEEENIKAKSKKLKQGMEM